MGLKNFTLFKRKTSPIIEPKQEVCQSSKYYYSIEVLPLIVFWNICVTGDKGLLVTEGSVSEEKINEAWDNITSDYTDLVSPETSRKIKNKRKIATLQAKYDCVYSALHLLRAYAEHELNDERKATQQKICDVINSVLPSLKINYSQTSLLLGKLKTAEAKAKNWTVTINDLKKQIKETSGEEKASTYADFQNMLAATNIHHGLTFTETQLTVLAFATYYKRMIEDIEHQKAQLATNGRVRKH